MIFSFIINNYIKGNYTIEELTRKFEFQSTALDETKTTEEYVKSLADENKRKSSQNMLSRKNRKNDCDNNIHDYPIQSAKLVQKNVNSALMIYLQNSEKKLSKHKIKKGIFDVDTYGDEYNLVVERSNGELNSRYFKMILFIIESLNQAKTISVQ